VKPLLLVSILAISLALGCTPQAQTVVQDVGQAALCVDQAVSDAVMSGMTTFEDIVAAILQQGCGPVSIAAVEAIINLLKGQAAPGSVLAAKLAAVHHKAP
jgi:hypothetical protein